MRTDESLVLEVPEAGAMVGLTRNASYAAAKRGDIPTIRFGRLLKVPRAAWLLKLEGSGAIESTDKNARKKVGVA
jgi:hypothetical protein